VNLPNVFGVLIVIQSVMTPEAFSPRTMTCG
jgi:hypothetical protein